MTPDGPLHRASSRDIRTASLDAPGAPVGDQSGAQPRYATSDATEARDVARAFETTSSSGDPSAGPNAGPSAARKFVGRLAQLDVAAARTAVADWHQTMRAEPEAWFAAEEALGQAVVTSGRRAAQEPLLMDVAQAFARAVWYGAEARGAHAPVPVPAPELRVRASEAAGQYLATVAMLAVLVRDHLDPATFALLYRPFALLIPPAALAPE